MNAALLALIVATSPATPAAQRIVSIGGAVTELVFALGKGDSVVAVDGSSVLPAQVTKLPQVGYHRAISAEGVLAMKPDLVLLTTEAGPPAAVAALKEKARVVVIPEGHSIEAAHAKVNAVAVALYGDAARAAALNKKLDDEIKALPAPPQRKPRVLALYSRGTGSVSAGGKGTALQAMIELAGGNNAIAIDGFKPISTEGIVLANPDVIVLPALGLKASGGVDAILALPGVLQTTAGKNKAIVSVEDLALLGFHHRTAEGVLALRRALLAVPAPERAVPSGW